MLYFGIARQIEPANSAESPTAHQGDLSCIKQKLYTYYKAPANQNDIAIIDNDKNVDYKKPEELGLSGTQNSSDEFLKNMVDYAKKHKLLAIARHTVATHSQHTKNTTTFYSESIFQQLKNELFDTKNVPELKNPDSETLQTVLRDINKASYVLVGNNSQSKENQTFVTSDVCDCVAVCVHNGKKCALCHFLRTNPVENTLSQVITPFQDDLTTTEVDLITAKYSPHLSEIIDWLQKKQIKINLYVEQKNNFTVFMEKNNFAFVIKPLSDLNTYPSSLSVSVTPHNTFFSTKQFGALFDNALEQQIRILKEEKLTQQEQIKILEEEKLAQQEQIKILE
jgi:hypothetical protein